MPVTSVPLGCPAAVAVAGLLISTKANLKSSIAGDRDDVHGYPPLIGQPIGDLRLDPYEVLKASSRSRRVGCE